MPRLRDDCRTPVARAQITTAMIALAFSVINCPEDAPEVGRVLAQMVLEAAEG